MTSCKCTSIDWTQDIIKPGEGGLIKAVFDSTNQDLGDLEKTIDILSNTDPIIVEAWFRAVLVE